MQLRYLASAAIAAAVFAMPAHARPTFILNNLGGVEAGTAARSGFEQAAALWAAVLGDEVTIRLDVGFRALSSGVLGSVSSSRSDVAYSTVRSRLYSDRTSALDSQAYSTLSSSLQFYSNEAGNCTTGVGCRAVDHSVRAWDADGTRDNRFLGVQTALQKALGLIGDSGWRDGTVSFSTAYKWDFDRSNGISSGFYDFVGIAAHEIGHALGFSSGVDLADGYAGRTGLDNIAWGTVLDLFRYQGGRRDWTVGGAPCLSADRGVTCIGDLSTGSRGGDGRQASHWKANRGIGILSPTASTGEFLRITGHDLSAFDIIGWNLAQGLSTGGVSWGDGLASLQWGTNLMWSGDEIGGDEMASDFAPAAVPAPGGLALFGLGLLAFVGARRLRVG